MLFLHYFLSKCSLSQLTYIDGFFRYSRGITSLKETFTECCEIWNFWIKLDVTI